jgi:hypothetical protein
MENEWRRIFAKRLECAELLPALPKKRDAGHLQRPAFIAKRMECVGLAGAFGVEGRSVSQKAGASSRTLQTLREIGHDNCRWSVPYVPGISGNKRSLARKVSGKNGASRTHAKRFATRGRKGVFEAILILECNTRRDDGAARFQGKAIFSA